jgi:hypothetical protein
MIAIPAEAEQKTDLVRIGKESIEKVNLSSVKLEAYNLWQLLLNDPLGDRHEHETVFRLKKGPVHPRSCHEELPNLFPRPGESKDLYYQMLADQFPQSKLGALLGH